MGKKKILSREEIKEKIRDKRSEEERGYQRDNALLEFKWTVSRARDSYGYNICSLYVNGRKVAACNGGGYSMDGTNLGTYIEQEFREDLISKEFAEKAVARVENYEKGFYGLTYHDPCYDPGKAEVNGKTVEQREQDHESFGLERYQAVYAASTKCPDDNHFIPSIDGACGFSSVEKILKALGYRLEYIKEGIYKLRKEVNNER